MLRKKICCIFLSVALAVSLPFSASADAPSISYNETTESFDNPECGFYIPVMLKLRESDNTIPENKLKPHLIHLRVDISDFGRSGTTLSASALEALEKTLMLIKQNGGTAILRFAYDSYFSGTTVSEPSLKIMKNHIRQISTVLEKYEPVIVCIEAGMLGLYGEYHGTNSCTKKNRIGILDAWNGQLSSKFMISARTPGQIAEWAGISLKKLCRDGSSKKGMERMGIYNDGYLGSNSDLGTYANRENELDWMDEQTDTAFFGGEMVAYYDNDTPKNTSKYMESEGFITHTSYLNELWNDKVIENLKNEIFAGKNHLYKGLSGYQYVENHLGYRFVLTDSKVGVSQKQLGIFMQLENTGFGSMINDKAVTVLLASENNVYEFPLKDFDIRCCKSQYLVRYQTRLSIDGVDSGEYQVYLRISEYGDVFSDENYNCVRFANDGSQWNELLGANLLGHIEITGSDNPEESSAPAESEKPVESCAPAESEKPVDFFVPFLQISDLNKRFETTGGIRYKLDGSKAVIKRVENKKSITIPKTIAAAKKSYTVTGLTNDLFTNCSKLQSIKLLNTVKTIQSGTFSSCKKLKTITLNKSIKIIEKGSLPEKSLKKIIYPGKAARFKKLNLTWLHHVKVCAADKTFTLK